MPPRPKAQSRPVALVLCLGGVWIASSVGLWGSKAWGWKAAMLYYLYSSVHHAWTLWAVVAAAHQAGIDADPMAIFPTVSLPIHLAVFGYLLKANVAAWCELETVNRTLNVAVLFASAVLINIVVYQTQAGSPW
jgi:hypothetical protein